MKKITLKLAAIVLSAFIFLGGVGGSYIQGYCAESESRFADVVWNYDESVADNLLQYVLLATQYGMAYVDPELFSSAFLAINGTVAFLDYMDNDKGQELTEDTVPDYFENNVTINDGGDLILSDSLMDGLRHTAETVLEEVGGHWRVPTRQYTNFTESMFVSNEAYTNALLYSCVQIPYARINYYDNSGTETGTLGAYYEPMELSDFPDFSSYVESYKYYVIKKNIYVGKYYLYVSNSQFYFQDTTTKYLRLVDLVATLEYSDSGVDSSWSSASSSYNYTTLGAGEPVVYTNADILFGDEIYIPSTYKPTSHFIGLTGKDFLADYPEEFASLSSDETSTVQRINSDGSLSGEGIIHNGEVIFDPFTSAEILDPPVVGSENLHINCRPDGYSGLWSADGGYIRVWKSVDDYLAFNVGQQPYYTSSDWNSYDYAADNTTTMSGTFVSNATNGGVVNNYYNIVQTAIDDQNTDGTLTEDEIQTIVDDTADEIKTDNNTDTSAGTDSDDSDDSSGGGVAAVIEGIGKFFDTLLNLIGKIIGVISDFGNSVLELFDSFTVFTDGFSGFLSGTFGFIPEELWNVIISGITLMALLAVIKFLK